MIPRLGKQRETKVTVTGLREHFRPLVVGNATFGRVCEYMQIGVNEIHSCMIYELLPGAYLYVK